VVIESVVLTLVLSAILAGWIHSLSKRVSDLERPGLRVVERSSSSSSVEEEPGRFRTAFDSAAVGMAILSTRGDWLEANEAFFRVLGRRSGDLGSLDIFDLSHPEDAYKGCGDLCALFSGERDTCQIERRFLRDDGRLVWVSINVSVARDENSSPSCVLLQLSDITERRKYHDELRAAKETAEAANRSKSQFLANMSHEIRTPIHAVIGMTGLAMAADSRREQEKYLKDVTASAKSLLAIVNDVLDFSKIEAGKLDLCPIDFGLRSCVEDTLTSFLHTAESKGVVLSWKVDADVPETVFGDPGRVRQILVNLVNNSLRFTEHGEVEVKVETKSQEGDKVLLQLAVRDTGIGISKEKQEYIFDAFRQADGSTTRRYGGTGLGLAICRQLCDLMDGGIWLESEEGVGSTFFVSLSFEIRSGQPAESSESSEPAVVDPQALSILIVDEDEESASALRDELVRTGAKVALASDQESGEAHVQKSIAVDAPYSIVLCKTSKDGIDGFTLARSLRDFLDFRGEIILLSEPGQRGDAQRCQDLRIAGYLSLPVETTDLFEAITESISKGAGSGEQPLVTKHSIREKRRSLRVLVVEDNGFCQELASCLIQKWGHVAELASNGVEALECVAQKDFDVILMDMQMPVMGGIEAIQRIREEEAQSGDHLPIIAMTANVLKQDVEACLQAGADEFLSKPVTPDGLRNAIEEVHRCCRALRIKKPDLPVDPSSILATFGDSYSELAPRLAEVVLREQPGQIRDLEEALERGDTEEVRRISHTIKGTAAQFGAHTARDMAWKVESISRDGSLDGVEELVTTLSEELERFQEFLRTTDWNFDAVGAC